MCVFLVLAVPAFVGNLFGSVFIHLNISCFDDHGGNCKSNCVIVPAGHKPAAWNFRLPPSRLWSMTTGSEILMSQLGNAAKNSGLETANTHLS